jgi:hypothetical protein
MKKFDAIVLATVDLSSISDIQRAKRRRNPEHFGYGKIWALMNLEVSS